MLEVIADVRGELLAAQDDVRMPRKEEQQVQIARVPETDRLDRARPRRLDEMWNVLDALVSLAFLEQRKPLVGRSV
jgi:hypothetical protein